MLFSVQEHHPSSFVGAMGVKLHLSTGQQIYDAGDVVEGAVRVDVTTVSTVKYQVGSIRSYRGFKLYHCTAADCSVLKTQATVTTAILMFAVQQ